MNHVVGVTTKSVKFRIRSIVSLKRNRAVVTNSSPALLAVGR